MPHLPRRSEPSDPDVIHALLRDANQGGRRLVFEVPYPQSEVFRLTRELVAVFALRVGFKLGSSSDNAWIRRWLQNYGAVT